MMEGRLPLVRNMAIVNNPLRVLLAALLLVPAMMDIDTARADEAIVAEEVDSVMHQDPKIDLPPTVKVFSPKLKPLWLEALARPEMDLKRLAAETIAQAHQEGMPSLEDTAEPLIEALSTPEQHPLVKLAAARALVVLDARQAAPQLFERAQRDGIIMAQVVEPALARWDYSAIRDIWLQRLANPETPQIRLRLAIDGVQTVEESRAEPHLKRLTVDPLRPPDIRLAAARAWGRLRSDGLEAEAGRFAADKSSQKLIERLIAVSLLARHSGEAAEDLLRQLAVDSQPVVATPAMRRLLEIDPALLVPIARETTEHRDANIRRLAAEALLARPTLEHIELLGPMLNDPHPDVRTFVRRSLLALAEQPQFDEAIREEGMTMLATEQWAGLEQAALLLAALDHKPAADRLVELLEFQRPEVFITAAWALRKLAVPESLPGMLASARRTTERQSAITQDNPFIMTGREVDMQLAQIFQTFGAMTYADSVPLLMRFVPKKMSPGPESRGAAIWALGHIYAGEPQEELVKALISRLNDVASMPPEYDEVRRMSAVTLGRMKAEGALETLRKYYHPEQANSIIARACGWAVEQLTGEPLPPVRTQEQHQTGWFLEPLK